MINEIKFDEALKQYNKEMNKRKKSSQADSELELRQVLEEEIKVNNSSQKLIETEYIDRVLEQGDYIELHKTLQQIFNEFIPFSTIRRFIHKIESYGIEKVCRLINEYKYLSYSDAICSIR